MLAVVEQQIAFVFPQVELLCALCRVVVLGHYVWGDVFCGWRELLWRKEMKLWVIMSDRRVQVAVIYLVSWFLFLPFMFYYVFVCFFLCLLVQLQIPNFFFSSLLCCCFDSFRRQRRLHYCMHRELISRTFMMLTLLFSDVWIIHVTIQLKSIPTFNCWAYGEIEERRNM